MISAVMKCRRKSGDMSALCPSPIDDYDCDEMDALPASTSSCQNMASPTEVFEVPEQDITPLIAYSKILPA